MAVSVKTSIHRGSWIVTLPLAGLAVAYLLVFFLPGQRAVERLSDQLASEQEFIAQSGAVTPAIRITRHQLQKTLAYNAAWAESAPSEGDLAALFGSIHALAKASGSATTRFDPEPALPMEKIRRIAVSVGCTGTFGQISRFLYELENLPQTIWVTRLKLESFEQNREEAQCDLDLIIFADNRDDSDQVDLAG